MILRRLALHALALSLTLGTARAAPEIRFAQVFEKIKTPLPTSLVIPDDDSERRFLVLQGGKILILPDSPKSDRFKTFLDISGNDLIDNAFEEGLLGLAFHPKFKDNGLFYIYYTQQDPKHSVVSEMRVSKKDPNKANLSTERVLFEIQQPFWNHNSGNLLFGPDAHLYFASGDGGKRDDPHRLAQNLFTRNGKIFRIDVDGRSGSRPYGVPADNPFAKVKGVHPEIWAFGLRNPWGLSFDREGRFWCADVGQDLYEEIDLIVKGGNYGWSYREGAHDFAKNPQKPPPGADFIDPIHEYGRKDGTSITGGFVYEGEGIPGLAGAYVYGDWGSGRVWALRLDNESQVSSNELLHERTAEENRLKRGKFQPSAFCPDLDGEILVLGWEGKIWKMVKGD